MNFTILIDNKTKDDFLCEWGFSVFIEYEGKNFLLDTGKSDNYLLNAEKLGINTEDADFAVLSHAHYDHSSGFRSFFEKNTDAKLYINKNCRENCYGKRWIFKKYIGIPKGLVKDYGDRIIYTDGFYEITDGVYLLPHISEDLDKIGKTANLFRRENRRFIPDDFNHEQSLVFKTEKGLVIFNSCTHGGLDSIAEDVNTFLPGEKIYMTVGGLHLSKFDDDYIRKTAEKINNLGIEKIITGHCTGDRAFDILKEKLGDKTLQSYSSMIIEV